ncbi:MAG TPA: XRE family transcriptional regulator [Thermoanaerobaculia bacterium]
MSINQTFHLRFTAPPLFRLVVDVTWRERLRSAIERSGRKNSAIARDAGIAPETLSRILTGTHRSPTFDTIVRIARAVNENVGWLLDERGFALSADEIRQLRGVVSFLSDNLIGSAQRREREEQNVVAAGNTDIPRPYSMRGARLVYEAAGDSMIGAGISDGDILFVKPTRNTREAAGRVVVCRIDASDYMKVLDIRGGHIRLLSRNDRYPPIELTEESDRFELIGVVVGRTGSVA